MPDPELHELHQWLIATTGTKQGAKAWALFDQAMILFLRETV